MNWTAEREQELRERWAAGEKRGRILQAMDITQGSLRGRIVQFNLPPRGAGGRTIAPNHAAAVEGRTVFTKAVTAPDTQPVLKRAGSHQKKLGNIVRKGRWLGMPLYSLTLEERATCPRSCATWFSCYGNNMPFSRRYTPSPELLHRLMRELAALSGKHRGGFVVRLHTLGDFYSVEYVAFWRLALERFTRLNVFGYTAWQPDTEIGRAVAELRDACWERFSVRTSGAIDGPRTLVVETEDGGDAVVCPVETGRSANCASCGLCWNSKSPIAFVRH